MKPTVPLSGSADLSEKLDLDNIAHHPRLPETAVSRSLDGLLNRIGGAFSWIWVILMAIIVLNVLLRYVFGEGRIEFEEMQWHLYAVGWLIAQSFCFVHDDHVRVDLIHDYFSPKGQAWVELLGSLLLLLPFIMLVLWYAVPFIEYAIETGERSNAPGGLGHRWIIKSFLFIGFGLLLLAMLSRLSRVCALLFGWGESLPDNDDAGSQHTAEHRESTSGAHHGN